MPGQQIRLRDTDLDKEIRIIDSRLSELAVETYSMEQMFAKFHSCVKLEGGVEYHGYDFPLTAEPSMPYAEMVKTFWSDPDFPMFIGWDLAPPVNNSWILIRTLKTIDASRPVKLIASDTGSAFWTWNVSSTTGSLDGLNQQTVTVYHIGIGDTHASPGVAAVEAAVRVNAKASAELDRLIAEGMVFDGRAVCGDYEHAYLVRLTGRPVDTGWASVLPYGQMRLYPKNLNVVIGLQN